VEHAMEQLAKTYFPEFYKSSADQSEPQPTR
jgi:hypothetical protein